MDRNDNRSPSPAPHPAKSSSTSRGEGWMPEAMRHLLEVATAERRT